MTSWLTLVVCSPSIFKLHDDMNFGGILPFRLICFGCLLVRQAKLKRIKLVIEDSCQLHSSRWPEPWIAKFPTGPNSTWTDSNFLTESFRSKLSIQLKIHPRLGPSKRNSRKNMNPVVQARHNIYTTYTYQMAIATIKCRYIAVQFAVETQTVSKSQSRFKWL